MKIADFCNFFTIRPRKEEDRKLFSEFRNEDVAQMFIWNCILTPLMLLGDFSTLAADPTYPNFIIFFLTLVLTAFTGTTWLLGQKYRSKYVFMIFTLLAFANVLALITIELVELGYKAEWKNGPSRLGGYFMFIVTLAPSIRYVIMYTVVFYVSVNIISWRHDKADSLPTWFIFSIVIVVFWFVF